MYLNKYKNGIAFTIHYGIINTSKQVDTSHSTFVRSTKISFDIHNSIVNM